MSAENISTEDDWADLDGIDLSDVEGRVGGDFEPFGAGIYSGIVTKVDTWSGENKTTGEKTRSQRFHYECDSGARKGDTYTEWFNVPFGDVDEIKKALSYVKGRYESLGVPKGFTGKLTEELVLGVPVVFVIKERQGTGKHEGKTFLNLASVAVREQGVAPNTSPAGGAALEADEDDPFAD